MMANSTVNCLLLSDFFQNRLFTTQIEIIPDDLDKGGVRVSYQLFLFFVRAIDCSTIALKERWILLTSHMCRLVESECLFKIQTPAQTFVAKEIEDFEYVGIQ